MLLIIEKKHWNMDQKKIPKDSYHKLDLIQFIQLRYYKANNVVSNNLVATILTFVTLSVLEYMKLLRLLMINLQRLKPQKFRFLCSINIHIIKQRNHIWDG